MGISLRKIEPSDLPFLYQWENDATVWADGSNHNPLSRQDLREYIEHSTGDIYRDEQLRLIIEHAGSTLGCVDLFDLDARNRRAAIGLYLAPSFRGQGYAEETIKQLERYAFQFLHLRLLYAIVSVSNTASNHIFEKNDYTPSSLLKHWTLEDDARIWIKPNPDIKS